MSQQAGPPPTPENTSPYTLLPVYSYALTEPRKVPACPNCSSTKLIACAVDRNGTCAAVVCENGHGAKVPDLAWTDVAAAFKVEQARGEALSRSIQAFSNEFRPDVTASTDRAAVILTASLIDTVLELLIRCFAVQEDKLDEALLDPSRPLGTFSSRIDFCYFFGLISAEEWQAIDQLRHIRNAFAHRLERLTLEQQSLHDRVKDAARHVNIAPGSDEPPRALFDRLSIAIWSNLTAKLGLITRRPTTPMNPIHVLMKLV